MRIGFAVTYVIHIVVYFFVATEHDVFPTYGRLDSARKRTVDHPQHITHHLITGT